MSVQSGMKMLSVHASKYYSKEHELLETVQLYLPGILKPDEAVERLRYSRADNQVSFHNEQALKYLHFESRRLAVFSGKSYFKGKDITMNPCIQIRDAADIIKADTGMSFLEALDVFYHSRTYKILQNTENTLWAESAGYIADCYFEE